MGKAVCPRLQVAGILSEFLGERACSFFEGFVLFLNPVQFYQHTHGIFRLHPYA